MADLNSYDSHDILLVNKPDNSIDDFDKYFINFSNISEIDNQLLIKELNELPCCLNEFLEKKMKTTKERFQLLELRNKNIKIKLYSMIYCAKEIVVCQYCRKHWSNQYMLKEIEINFAETNSNICICAAENHDFFKLNIIFNDLNDEIKGEIEEIRSLYEEDTIIQNKVIKVKDKILKLIHDKDKDTKLKIISSLMKINSIKSFFFQLDYNDEIYKIAFSCLKVNKNYSNYNIIMSEYLNNFFFQNFHLNEINMMLSDNSNYNYTALPALYYNNPDYFSYSFFFRAYRKKLISDIIDTNKVIYFLKKEQCLSNDIICSHMMNIENFPIDFFSNGFFSIDCISNLNSEELSKFKQNLNNHLFIISSIFRNQLYEIFFDFLKYGKTEHISLLDKSNKFSKLILESILDLSSALISPKNLIFSIKVLKDLLNNYLLYMFNFLDDNKIRKIAFLSSFSLSIGLYPKYQIEERKNDNYSDIKQEEFQEIFNTIDDNVNKIIKDKKRRKNNSLYNILIVSKLLKIYKIKLNYDDDKFKIEDLYYDFNEIILNIIEKDYPIKLTNKIIQLLNGNSEELNIYLGYLVKIISLCCTNIIGSSYIYNSNFIPKLLLIIKKLNYSIYSEIILDLLIILKVTFNREIIDISFLKMKNEENEMTVKEYLIDILFRNEPIISNNSMYDFNLFDRLLKKINTIYSFIFEKGKKKLFSESFDGINSDASYLKIIKTISKNMTEEFNKLKWKNEIIPITVFTKNEELIDINEKKIEKLIKEKININEKIPRFILIDILRCLENLNQTNFYLEYKDDSYFVNNKYNLYSIINEDKLPFSIKSLILNYLLKLVITLKIDKNNNKIYGPLIYTSRYEKECKENNIDVSKKEINKYLITLESKESERHMNESLKLMNIYNVCLGILKKKKEILNFKKAFIKKNGLYDFCVSIIRAIYCFSNLIINTNKIHELYLSAFIELASEFFKNKDLFIDIINDEKILKNEKINNQKIELITNESDNSYIFDYKEKILIIIEVNKKIQQLIDKINLDSYNFSDNKQTSIYQSFNDYNEEKFNLKSNDHYEFIYLKKNENITLEELNEFNGMNNTENNSKVFNNYKEWKKYNHNEYYNVNILFNKIFNLKNDSKTRRENFYTHILIHIADLKSEGEYILNDHLFLKSLIKIIKDDFNFKNYYNDENMEINLKKYKNININNISEFKARIIGNIIRKIYFLTNYELLISHSFSNTKQENILTDLLNSLILFLEILSENFNQFFHEAVFEYKFDFTKEKDNSPVAKYDEVSQTFKMLNEKNIENNNIHTPYEILLKLHQKIFETLKIANNDKYRDTLQNNLLIIFNSLTYCIVEYTNFDNPVYKLILEKLYLRYFCWKKEDNSYNPLFLAINFEIDKNMNSKPKNNFLMNNILTLFIYYLRYSSKEISKTYFFENSNYYIYTPIVYCFHVFFYTSQIVDNINKNILTDEKNGCKELIELYKKKKFQNNDLFVIAKRYYILLFLSKTFYGYDILKSILPDNEDKQINSNKIIEYFTDNYHYSKILYELVIDDNNLDEYQKASNYSKKMNIVFDFWRNIFKSLEIIINGQNKIIYCIKRPEIFYFSKDERIYYEDKINYSSRESKLISMYDNIDSFIFEMISNSNYQKFNLANIFYYFGLELINIFFFIIENIILLIFFYKSWEEDYSKYNEIDNNKTSIAILILSGIHFLYIITILINWFINRLKIDYYYALTRNSSNILKPKLKLSLYRKAVKFRRLYKNYSLDFKTINEFYPEINEREKRYILIMHTIILNPKVYPFIVSFICLILQFVSKIFIVFPLLLIANLIPTLSAIFKGLFSKLKYLIFIYSYTLIVLYIFSWIGFLFLPHLFKFEVVNKRNEYIVDQNLDTVEEYICSSSIQCILYFLNFGLSSGGSLDLNLISFKDNYGFYLRQFFFDVFFFLFINMIFSNIFLALITDAFTEMRELAWKSETDKIDVCFICGLTKSDCIFQNKDFNIHIQEHSKWNYINFMCKLILEDDVDFNRDEYYIWELMKKKNIDWFPIKQENLVKDKE